jgi:hypothetical protein
VVEMKNADRRESAARKPGSLRCPACFLVQDFAVEDLICTLTRCPRAFIYLDRPVGPTVAVGACSQPRGRHQMSIDPSRSPGLGCNS